MLEPAAPRGVQGGTSKAAELPKYRMGGRRELFQGARPSEPPVEQPTEFEVMNLKTVKQIGLTIVANVLHERIR